MNPPPARTDSSSDAVSSSESGRAEAATAEDKVRVASLGLAGEVVVHEAGAVWFGSVMGVDRGAEHPRARELQRLLEQLVRKLAGGGGTLAARLEEVSTQLDRALCVPGPGFGAVSLVLGVVEGNRAQLAWTASGAAYLVRAGGVCAVAESARFVGGRAELGGGVNSVEPPARSLGGRSPASTLRAAHLVHGPWHLRKGDRLVVVSDPLSRLLRREELGELLATGPTEGVVHTLETLLSMRGRPATSVFALEIGSELEAELMGDDGELQSLLDGLEELVPQALATGHLKPTAPPEEPLRPTREPLPFDLPPQHASASSASAHEPASTEPGAQPASSSQLRQSSEWHQLDLTLDRATPDRRGVVLFTVLASGLVVLAFLVAVAITVFGVG